MDDIYIARFLAQQQAQCAYKVGIITPTDPIHSRTISTSWEAYWRCSLLGASHQHSDNIVHCL